MPVACRLDGPQPEMTAEPSLEATLFAALAEALEIPGLDPLLMHLAGSWCDVTRAECVILAVQSAPGGRYRVVVSGSHSGPMLSDYTLPDCTDLLEGLREEFGRRPMAPRCGEPSVSMTGKPLYQGVDAWPMGGLLLSAARPLPEKIDRQLLQATAALLAQAADQDHRLRSAKLESLAQFAAGAGHEINNPLAAISGRAQLLLRQETDSERRRHLQTIGAQALRIRDMIGDTMLFARPPAPQPQLVNLPTMIDRVLESLTEAGAARGLTWRREFDGDVPIWADAAQLCVVLSELVRNAIEASPVEGTVHIAAAPTIADGRPWATFRVQDEGPGLSDEAARHLFDPFYSGRQAGRGLGFGLSKCWRIVTGHGGRIDVENDRRPGFSIIVHWPACDGATSGGNS
jgi:signal transduction histidine kinase